MTIRCASLLAAAALAGLAAPALAQDYDPGRPPPLPRHADYDWSDDGQWEEDVYADDGDYGDERRVEVYRVHRDDAPDGYRPLPPLREGESWGYSPEQRAQWLEECRATSYRDDRGEQRGQVVGGVLGGVAGGVAGNRIAGRGDRLGGTLIGAGVGALAGAVVGGAVGRDSDRDRVRDDCEAYLAEYEQSYRGPAPGYGYDGHAQGGYAHQGGHPRGGYREGEVGYAYPYPYPVMWVRVPIVTERRHDCGCETVIEEVVEERPAPRARRVVHRTGDKRIRLTK